MSGISERIHRRRKTLSLTLDPSVANKVEELAKEKRMSKSRIVDSIFSLGATRFEQLYRKAEKPHDEAREEVKPEVDSKTKGDRLAEAYMRRKLLSTDPRDWTPV